MQGSPDVLHQHGRRIRDANAHCNLRGWGTGRVTNGHGESPWSNSHSQAQQLGQMNPSDSFKQLIWTGAQRPALVAVVMIYEICQTLACDHWSATYKHASSLGQYYNLPVINSIWNYWLAAMAFFDYHWQPSNRPSTRCKKLWCKKLLDWQSSSARRLKLV